MKNYPILFCSLFLVLVLAGCGGSTDKGKTVIRYARWGNVEGHKATKRLLKLFMEKNPDISVDYQGRSWSGYWRNLQTAIAGGDAPDVFLIHPNYFVDFYQKGTLENLNPYMKDFDKNAYVDVSFEMYSINDENYALPTDVNTILLYYNKDHFDRKGLTYPDGTWDWDKLVAAGKALNVDQDNDGKNEIYGLHSVIHYEIFYGNFLHQNSTSLFSPDGKKILINTPAAKEAFSFLLNLESKHKISPPQEVVDSLGSAISLFESETVSMTFNGTWMLKQYRNMKSFNWGIAPLPGNKKRGAICNSIANAISADSKHKDAAWRLVRFFAEKEAQRVIARSGTAMPILKSVLNSKDYLGNPVPGNLEVAIKTLEHGRPYPKVKGLNKVFHIIDTKLNEAALGADLNKMLFEAEKEITEELKL